MTKTIIQELIGKPLTMWVTDSMTLHATVLNQNEIEYHIIDTDDPNGNKTIYKAPLEIKYDDIEHVNDYSFIIQGVSRYFLHQFDVVTSTEPEPVTKKLRLAHFPQVPCKPFYVSVKSLEQAQEISNILADYDRFQYETRIKGDYANMTVLEEFDPEEQDWLSWSDEETGIDNLDEYFEYIEDIRNEKLKE